MMSVLVPVLERADLAREAAFESQHHAATCSPGHNHTLCTQVGASHALPSRQDLRVGVSPFVGGAVAGHLRSVFVPVLAEGHPTRAPPSI